MTIKEFVSGILKFRIKDSDSGWDEAYEQLGRTGQFTISSAPKMYEKIVIELCKRVDKLEHGNSTNL